MKTEKNKAKTKPLASKKPAFDFDKTKFYSIEEAVELAKKSSKTKFLSSIDIAIKLNLDTTKSDQQLRGTVSLPYFFGKEKRILVLDKGLTQKDAKNLGVAYAGDSETIAEISKGWLDFDLIITTPKMMPELSKLGKILGTRGLMPNPKNGNVTTDLSKTISEFKKGISQYRTDNYGNIHMVVGKTNADTKKIVENVEFLISFINSKKPAAVKGIFMEKINISSTMGPGIKVLINKGSAKKSVSKKVDKDSKKSVKEESKKVYLKPMVKYSQKKKPSKNPENPPIIVEAKKKKEKKKIVKKAKTKKPVASKPIVTKENKKLVGKNK
ncbi:MAG: 50S ribosomal protein L1, partial [Malacoplasma sp.]|nr:50S ribosomal protein L1 [Malacoplasma sp.]